ncbi:LacI family DNA-binding transcriptional regulator [Herbiconiux solani]|uniref:LacI family DNA-binding transcriptional regulator n=1 Tax=Herbiconiux solani TaxID=661329 RepID=UPI000826EDFF|nr:LacI family DNA-binding transcriptional regulator [Herbiconiux solani]
MSTPENVASHAAVRMEDVAKRAGVALGTVSNVLNQPQKVSQKTIDKVVLAIDELGFVPNRAARALAAGTSNTIGMVIADLSNSFFVDMARGAERLASESGINVVLANTDMRRSKQAANLNLFRQERMAGILLAPLPGADPTLLTSNATPLVFLNDAAIVGACTVSVDNEHGGYLAASHLLGLGRRRLLFAGDPDQAVPIADRYRGVERAVAEVAGATLELARTPEVQAENGRELGIELTQRASVDRPDGIVASADLLALGLVQIFGADPSIRIPEDIAITGYDNNRAAWDSLIPITTIDQPGEQIGAVAAELLLDEIRFPETHRHVHSVLQPSLVVRASTRRP